MRRKDWWTDVALVAALVALVLAIVCLAGRVMRTRAADAQAKEIMAEAKARIDLYEMAQTQATERPTAAVVIIETPTLEPSEAPAQEEDKPVEDWYIPELPLDKQLQRAVFEAACSNGVDHFTALGLIRVESDFRTDAVNPVSGCYGLCQLNPAWFPSGLTPAENVRAGMEYLGELITRYDGDVPAALRAYNRGYDDGDRGYSTAVLAAREEIMHKAGVVEK